MSNVGDTIYLVCAERGAYSDREEWVESVHATETGAREARDRADAKYRAEWEADYGAWGGTYEEDYMSVCLTIERRNLEW